VAANDEDQKLRFSKAVKRRSQAGVLHQKPAHSGQVLAPKSTMEADLLLGEFGMLRALALERGIRLKMN